MDGYAVRAEDVAFLRRSGSSARLWRGAVCGRGAGQGEAVRIFTGAPVPKGADTIAIQAQEDPPAWSPSRRRRPGATSGRAAGFHGRRGALARSHEARAPRADARRRYEPCRASRSAHVAILATGDEVVPPGTELERDQIVSSVPAGLAALIEAQGGEPVSLGIAKDTPET